MPSVAVTRSVAAARPAPRHPKATIVSEHGHKVVLRYAPEVGQLSGYGWDWKQQARGDRKALVQRGAHRLKLYTYTVMVCDPDPQVSVEPDLTALRYLVDLGERVTFTNMGSTVRGLFRLSLDGISPIKLQLGTNNITQCTVGLTFLEAVDPVSRVGPLTGGAGGPTNTGQVTHPTAPPPAAVDPGLRTPERS